MTTTNPSETPSEWVRTVETGDGAVLLDIQNGICLSLTPVAAMIWRLLTLNASRDQIVNELTQVFDVPRQQVADDVREFIRELSDKRLLAGNDDRDPARALCRGISILHRCRSLWPRAQFRPSLSTHFLFWKALFGLICFDLFRLENDFRSIYLLVSNWTPRQCTTATDAVACVSKALNYACVWYPKHVLCLQRSVVFTCMLRNYGISARMVLGAQKFPFEAHAWTEVDGCAVNERRDVDAVYLIWERC